LNNLYIFDLDGTLIDSSDQILEALNFTLNRNGLPIQERSEIFPLIGLPPARFLSNLDLSEVQIANLITEFRNRLLEISIEGVTFYPGAVELLAYLKQRGDYISVATNKPTALAGDILRGSEVWPYLDYLVGSDGIRPKPAPDIVEKTLQNFNHRGIAPDKFFMIGDRNEDIESGRQVGASCVFIQCSGHVLTLESIAAGTLSFETLWDYYKFISLE
jgi:phosphoglycolate phosphatase